MVAIMQNHPGTAILFILAGAVFDFFDGFFARILKAGSPFGKEYDSLADMVTFGLLPAYLMFFLLMETSGRLYAYASLLIAIASGIRLARFNLSDNQKDHFVGLPTPANAFFLAGLVGIYLADWKSFNFIFNNPYILIIIVIILVYLMNSKIHFISLKFSSPGWKGNQYRYIIIIAGAILILFLQIPGIFFVMVIYLALSIYRHFLQFLRPSS
jgi:CDP-diacylglycerol--serine O-phosphatidyltransferase